MFADYEDAVFEGTNHPYKQNLLRMGGEGEKKSISQVPEVRAAIKAEAQLNAPEATPSQ